MKKLMITALSFVVLGISNAVMAEIKIAVVDVQTLVSKSSQVQALKKEQQAKIQDLERWLITAREDVKNQKAQEEKERLIKKYDTDFIKKKEAIFKSYQIKLQAIDKSLTETIVNEAKAKGYDLVLSKQGAVLYGGLDITGDLLKVVK